MKFFNKLSRFALVGGVNTGIDIAIITLLSWLFPATNLAQLIGYNTLAYSIGACNSFVLNKFWTFSEKTPTTAQQIGKFVLVTLGGIVLNNLVLGIFAAFWPQLAYGSALNTLTLKVSVAVTCMLLSFIGVNFLVFVGKDATMQIPQGRFSGRFNRSISVILPAYNEEENIGVTVRHVINYMSQAVNDYEIIVVNDGSKDRTAQVVEHIGSAFPWVRLINHPVNRGYGAALVSGFTNTRKELAFFMDSDGQFDIRDLALLLPYIHDHDAVLGYRQDRQDRQMRKLNAWCWKQLIRLFFGIKVRDVDCAFKLFRADFFYKHKLETTGAMINTEIMYKWVNAGYTYTEVGVKHLPRTAGRATGAKLSVIVRALRELFIHAERWSQI